MVYSCLIVGGRPFSRPLDNHLQLLNEAMITFYLLMLGSLTDYNQVNPYKTEIAYTMLATIMANIAINFLKAFADLSRMLKIYVRRQLALKALRDK
jgi:hypothetical protein